MKNNTSFEIVLNLKKKKSHTIINYTSLIKIQQKIIDNLISFYPILHEEAHIHEIPNY